MELGRNGKEKERRRGNNFSVVDRRLPETPEAGRFIQSSFEGRKTGDRRFGIFPFSVLLPSFHTPLRAAGPWGQYGGCFGNTAFFSTCGWVRPFRAVFRTFIRAEYRINGIYPRPSDRYFSMKMGENPILMMDADPCRRSPSRRIGPGENAAAPSRARLSDASAKHPKRMRGDRR
jgi:hypothetical protein